jgi:hypothetical protein
MKPALTRPSTPTTRAANPGGRLRLNVHTPTVHAACTRIQSRSDPSWPPHTAASRYGSGSREFEFWATYRTEKSL